MARELENIIEDFDAFRESFNDYRKKKKLTRTR